MVGFISIYPPIIDTYMPVFDRGDDNDQGGICRVYFSLSSYNSLDEINKYGTQVLVNNQLTNKTVLDSGLYPSGIKITKFEIDHTRNTSDKYYIEISKNDLASKQFELNQFYKVQIRFTAAVDGVTAPSSSQGIDSWLNQNLNYFSEWSTVCLIKGIKKPSINLVNFTNPNSSSEGVTGTVFATSTVSVIGKVVFEEGEQETLKKYTVRLFQNGNLISDSGDVYPNAYTNINEINYVFKNALTEGIQYKFELTITTRNFYTVTNTYYFKISTASLPLLDIDVKAYLDLENARTCIHIQRKSFNGDLIIRRASSKTDFTIWEDMNIANFAENDGIVEYDWSDFTIESGIWYQYSIQHGIDRGDYIERGLSTIIPVYKLFSSKSVMVEDEEMTPSDDNLVMGIFEHLYLVADGRQLKVKFNPSISSFKHTIPENKVDTIGSKYPFIRKNGNTDYRSFPITGIITMLSDEEQLFATSAELLQNNIGLYNKYKYYQNITQYNDFIYEKLFRDKVIQFLYDNNVKLFKSATEGNILVNLMDINLTPNAQLGRYIYSFSCTAHEIAEDTVENYDLYKIQKRGMYVYGDPSIDSGGGNEPEIISTYKSIGQVNNYTMTIGLDTNIITLIQEMENSKVENEYIARINNFSYLRIEFNDKPYLIKEANNRPVLANQGDKDAYLGYLMYINNNPIAINKEGIYELTDNEMEIYSIYFERTENIILTYIVDVSKVKGTAITTGNKLSIDQILYKTYETNPRTLNQNNFEYEASVYQIAKDEIDVVTSTSYKKLVNITAVEIESDYGVTVWIKTSKDTQYKEYTIGLSYCLNINQTDLYIEDFYFTGQKFFEYETELLTQTDGKWVYDNKPIKIFQIDNNGWYQEIENSVSVNLKINTSKYVIQTLDDVVAKVTIVYETEEGTN